MSDSDYYVYILTNWNHQVMYVGSTKDLARRLKQHRSGNGADFTRKYKVNKLVYFEKASDMKEALRREGQLKRWRRKWKDSLVETVNPEWEDLLDAA